MGNRSLKELYEKLAEKHALPTVLIDGKVLGYPVYRGETEGGQYDEMLYVTELGTVVYGLVPTTPVCTHECPRYEKIDAKFLIDRCNEDAMNQLPKIAL